MLLKLLLFILGIYLVSLSITFIIIYLNLLNQGYNFMEYVQFIIRRPEILSIFLGLFLIFISFRKGKIK